MSFVSIPRRAMLAKLAEALRSTFPKNRSGTAFARSSFAAARAVHPEPDSVSIRYFPELHMRVERLRTHVLTAEIVIATPHGLISKRADALHRRSRAASSRRNASSFMAFMLVWWTGPARFHNRPRVLLDRPDGVPPFT